MAAELFKGEDPRSYGFSDDIHAIIIDNKLILATKAAIKDHVYTYCCLRGTAVRRFIVS